MDFKQRLKDILKPPYSVACRYSVAKRMSCKVTDFDQEDLLAIRHAHDMREAAHVRKFYGSLARYLAEHKQFKSHFVGWTRLKLAFPKECVNATNKEHMDQRLVLKCPVVRLGGVGMVSRGRAIFDDSPESIATVANREKKVGAKRGKTGKRRKPSQPEAGLVLKAKRALALLGWELVGTDPIKAGRGYPDAEANKSLRTVFGLTLHVKIEFKVDSPLEPHQARMIQELRNEGYIVWVINDLNELIRRIKDLEAMAVSASGYEVPTGAR